MQRRIGNARVESIAAESPKFTAPLVLIHGLWCTAAVWHKFMGYLAHRGWTCHALTLRGRIDANGRAAIRDVAFADYLTDMRQVIGACEAAPVLVGHDLGGLLALHCAPAEARAVVALAPLVPRPLARVENRALTRLGARIAMARSRPLPAPRGKLGADYFGHVVPGGVVRDSPRVARELTRDNFPMSASENPPALVVAGGRDPFSVASDVERLAARVGATFQCVAGTGHALPWEPGWETRVSEIHRWLLHTLGEGLLAMEIEDHET